MNEFWHGTGFAVGVDRGPVQRVSVLQRQQLTTPPER